MNNVNVQSVNSHKVLLGGEKVTKVKDVVELMYEVKLVKMAMFQCTHSLQYIMIVLIAPTQRYKHEYKHITTIHKSNR